MREDVRKGLIQTVRGFNTDSWVEDVELLNQILGESSSYTCEHDYALRCHNSNIDKSKVLCLDCGKEISEDKCNHIIDLEDKYLCYMDTIRLKYLELLYLANSVESINNLGEESGVRLSFTNNK